MYKHQGKSRTLKHNLRIATVLSFVAGIVNVTGFLTFHRLTTHVTGHFSLLIHSVWALDVSASLIYVFYIGSFFLGSFTSGVLIIRFRNAKRLNSFVLPSLIESFILLAVGWLGSTLEMNYADLMICLLLFTMGLQNSFVTKISNAVVRTTHLTGLFTDLGIEIAQLCFPKLYTERAKLKDTVLLRFYIIGFFLAGGLAGVYMYGPLGLKTKTLMMGAAILLVSLLLNDLLYGRLGAKLNGRRRS